MPGAAWHRADHAAHTRRSGSAGGTGPSLPRRIERLGDAFALFGPLLADGTLERLWVAFLDESGAMLALAGTAPADVDQVLLPIAAMLRHAVRRGAASLIVAHNHPSGNGSPSREDVLAIGRLHEAAQAIGLRLLDHIVVGRGGRCLSFRAMGLL